MPTVPQYGRTLAVSAFVLVISFIFLRSPLFEVERVTVSGLDQLKASEVVAELGLSQPTLIWHINPRQVQARLLHDPRIRTAQVSLRWPNRVFVRIAERQVVALIRYHERYFVAVASDGMATSLYAGLPAQEIPLLTGAALENAEVGQPVKGIPLLENVLRFSQALGPQGRKLLSEIHLQGPQVTAYTLSGITVNLGDGSNPEAKAQTLLGLLTDLQARGVKTAAIDLQSAASPVVKMKQSK